MSKIFLLTTVIVMCAVPIMAQNGTTKSSWQDVWKLDLTGFDFDPSKWSSGFKEKVIKAAIVGALVYVLSHNIMYSAMALGFTYGVVHLDYQFVLTALVTVYGYFRKQTLPLIAGAYCSYWLLWGQKPY